MKASQAPSAETSRLFVTSLAHGLRVLNVFREGAPLMKLADVAQAAGVSKSAAQRFTYTMVALGYLRKNPLTKEFSLAPKSLEVGLGYLRANPLIARSNPYLHSLNRACGETCCLAEPDGLEVVYVSRFPTHKQMFVNMPLGTRIPMYCTASGRAVLSRMDEAAAMSIFSRNNRVAYTANTITDLDRLRELLAQARMNGFAWADGEYYTGDINVGAPVLDSDGVAVAAVNISVPSSRFTLERAQAELGPQAVETARAISASQPEILNRVVRQG